MANAARREGQRVGTVGHPVYSALFPVPVVCFLGTLLTDFAYAKSGGNLLWLAFSSWLLLAGLLVGAIAALVLLVDVVRDAAMRMPFGWAHLLFFYAVQPSRSWMKMLSSSTSSSMNATAGRRWCRSE